MKFNKWTLALASAGVVSLGSVAQAEEAQNQVLTALSSTTLSGYVSTSAIWKFGTGNGPHGLAANNGLLGAGTYGGGKYDGFNLDVVKLSLSKPLDEGQWSAGYTFDMLFGPDAQVYTGGDDLAVQNAFVLMRAPVGNGLDIKMGLFETLIGYEPFDYTGNAHWSRSYGYGIEPLQHTGVTLAYQFTEWLRVEGGAANTYNANPVNNRSTFFNFEESETEKTYMGLITLTAPESFGALAGSTLDLGIVDGIDSASSGYYMDTTSFYAGITANTPWEAVKVGVAFDYKDGKTFDKESSDAYAIGGYITYQASEKLTIADRFEYANFDGFYATYMDDTYNENAVTLSDFDLISNTLTLNYKLWANVTTRAEFRWDHQLSDDDGIKVFGNSDEDSLWLGVNVVYQF